MLSFPAAIAAIAGVASGSILGAFITTKTEAAARGFESRVDPIAKVTAKEAINALASAAIAITLMACLIVVVVLGIVRLGGMNYLGRQMWVIFAPCFARAQVQPNGGLDPQESIIEASRLPSCAGRCTCSLETR